MKKRPVMKSNQVHKYHDPTKYDPMPYGTIWHVIGEEKIVGRYIQLSKDESLPNWQILGAFLETSLMPQIDKQEFIDLCLKSYEKNTTVS